MMIERSALHTIPGNPVVVLVSQCLAYEAMLPAEHFIEANHVVRYCAQDEYLVLNAPLQGISL
jgi:hypothetical protein